MLRDFWGEVHLTHSLRTLDLGPSRHAVRKPRYHGAAHMKGAVRCERPSPDLMIHYEVSQDSAYACTPQLRFIIICKGTLQNHKGKGARGKARRDRHQPLESTPLGVTQDAWIPPEFSAVTMRLQKSWTDWAANVYCHCQEGAKRQTAQHFYGGWACRHFLPSMSQDSRPSEGNWYLA